MKTIFVYGTLQKDQGNYTSFEMDKKSKYLGRATLYGWKRISFISLEKVKRQDEYVCGDVFEINDELEQDIYEFEHSFGYHRELVKPQLIENAKQIECIVYI
jgi:gamma-glutamylcyclotransferase (GGCT)/AIG2-like uncharacterized protein YtfP